MKTLSDHIKPLLAIVIVVLAFIYFFAVLAIERHVNDQVIIAIVAMVSAATGYYYGSNTGSSKKDQVIADMSSNPMVTNADTVNVKK